MPACAVRIRRRKAPRRAMPRWLPCRRSLPRNRANRLKEQTRRPGERLRSGRSRGRRAARPGARDRGRPPLRGEGLASCCPPRGTRAPRFATARWRREASSGGRRQRGTRSRGRFRPRTGRGGDTAGSGGGPSFRRPCTRRRTPRWPGVRAAAGPAAARKARGHAQRGSPVAREPDLQSRHDGQDHRQEQRLDRRRGRGRPRRAARGPDMRRQPARGPAQWATRS